MRLIRKLDNFFLGTGEGNWTDRLYFYGMYSAITIVTIIAI
ncbi:hypothetical protein [Psychrobacillus psychrodurans]|nr:hypothetical protein [Psychrobacillus psychrodurans]